MHFRVRKNAVQVVRTQYDAERKRARSTIVGRVPLTDLKISDEFAAACTPEELTEVRAWLRNYGEFEKLKQEYSAKSLPQSMMLAGGWFRQADPDAARLLAASIQREWVMLRTQLKKRGLIE
jgi:hypothetical protein